MIFTPEIVTVGTAGLAESASESCGLRQLYGPALPEGDNAWALLDGPTGPTISGTLSSTPALDVPVQCGGTCLAIFCLLWSKVPCEDKSSMIYVMSG